MLKAKKMEYKFFRTDQIDEATFASYVLAFNEIFEKDFAIDFFRNKYQNVTKGYSFHSFMIHEEKVVGACTFVPYEYHYYDKLLTFGLGVDVFVMPEFRKNLMALYQMYSQVKEAMQADGVSFSFAIPNTNAYPFWTKVLKWKNIGDLPYFVLPISFGKVLKKTTIFDGITKVLMQIWLFKSKIWSSLNNNEEQLPTIRINRQQKNLEQHRYFEAYKRTEGKANFSYKIYDEEGIKTAYLIDFYNENGKRDSKTLASAVSEIVNKNKVDLVIFVGEINFFQFSLIKLPKSKEPKRLPFIGEILNENDLNEDLFQYKNWEMGLFNYDVR
jgi:hypothetical protein